MKKSSFEEVKISFIREMFSDPKGLLDDARVAAFIIVLTFCGNSVISVVMNSTHIFAAQDFGIGAGALVAGIGILFGQRKDN
jgi:hypothetical protein